MFEVLGPELLGCLVGVSVSSTRRYLSQARHTPDVVAARLHFIALVVGDLAGAYNEIGLRPGASRDGKVFALFGFQPNLVGWAAAAIGHPKQEFLSRVRHF